MVSRTYFLLIDLGQIRRDRQAHELHGFDVLHVVVGAIVRLLAVVIAIVIDNKGNRLVDRKRGLARPISQPDPQVVRP